MTEKQFKKNEVIFREGESGETLYQIIDGVVGVYAAYGEAGEQLLTELTKDQFLGEMAVIEAYPRSATAVALTDVKATEIQSGEINQYFKAESDTIIDIMKHLGGRLRELTNDYGDVCATIEELHLGGDKPERSEGLIARIKKFAKVYQSSKIADQLSAETLRKLEQSGHADGYTVNVEGYNKGTIIFREGEKGDCMYDVHSGEVCIYKAYGLPEEKLLTKLMANEFFGELGMLDDCKRSTTAVVTQDNTTLEVIYPKDLKDLFEQNPSKVEMMLTHVSHRLRALTKEYMTACKLVYQVSDAEEKGTVSEALKAETANFKARLYG